MNELDRQNVINKYYDAFVSKKDGVFDFKENGKNLRAFRESLRVTREDVTVNMTASYVVELELGFAKPNADHYIQYISNVVGAAEIIHERIGRKLCLK